MTKGARYNFFLVLYLPKIEFIFKNLTLNNSPEHQFYIFFKKKKERNTFQLIFFFFPPGPMSCGILVPRPRIGAQSPNHWTPREVPQLIL